MEHRVHPLRTWRQEHKVTLADLAQRLGVGASHLSQVERGIGGLSLELASRIENETGIAISDLARAAA